MADITTSEIPAEELRAHRHSYMPFERLVLFAALHVALVLACLALAFLGGAPLIAFLLGVVGSIATIVGLMIRGQS